MYRCTTQALKPAGMHRCRGVRPSLFCAFGFAPPSRSTCLVQAHLRELDRRFPEICPIGCREEDERPRDAANQMSASIARCSQQDGPAISQSVLGVRLCPVQCSYAPVKSSCGLPGQHSAAPSCLCCQLQRGPCRPDQVSSSPAHRRRFTGGGVKS